MKNWQKYSGLLIAVLGVAAIAFWPILTGKAADREVAFTILKAIALASSRTGRTQEPRAGRRTAKHRALPLRQRTHAVEKDHHRTVSSGVDVGHFAVFDSDAFSRVRVVG